MTLLKSCLNSFQFPQLFSILRIKHKIKDNSWLVKSTLCSNMSPSCYKSYFYANHHIGYFKMHFLSVFYKIPLKLKASLNLLSSKLDFSFTTNPQGT